MITESQSVRFSEQRIPRKLFLLGFLAILVSLTIDELHAQSIPETERAALISLYESTDGDNWKDNTNWNGPVGTECSWYGVNCVSGAVYSLDLDGNNLNGKIPAAIGSLTQLQYLYLYNNSLSGVIPSEIGNLTRLESLFLYNNSLSSVIPSEIGNLTRLKYLMLNNNSLSGVIPSETGYLTQLQNLYLYNNSLSGVIPSEIGNLTRLEYLSLHNNSLSGVIPSEIGYLTQLQNLNLNNNSLSGVIPSEIGNLTQLQNLYLYKNSLSGVIPSEIGNLTQLTHLFLYDNLLSGLIPQELGGLKKLEYLLLAGNNWSGDLPRSISDLDISNNDLLSLRFIPLDVDDDGIFDEADNSPSTPTQFKRIWGEDYSLIYSRDSRIINVVHPALAKEFIKEPGPLREREISNLLYEHFDDQFDFLMVSPLLGSGGTNYHTPVKPRATGLGAADTQTVDNSELYGSAGVLKSFIFLTAVEVLKYGPGTHEVMHAWAAPEMFGASGHSGYSNLGGILGGWKPNTLKVLEDGNYQVEFVDGFDVPGPAPAGWAAAGIPYSNFELYLAGLISPEEVGHDIKQANGLRWIGKDNGIFSASSIETTTIEEFIARNGPRVPSHLESQKAFEALYVVITEKPISKEEWLVADSHAYWFDSPKADNDDTLYNFWESTKGKATISFNQTDHVKTAGRNYRLDNELPSINTDGIKTTLKDSDGKDGETIILTPILMDDTGIEKTEWLIDNKVIATGSTPSISLPNGKSTITIRVTDDDFDAVTTVVTIDVVSPFDVDGSWAKPFNGAGPKDSLNISYNNIGTYDFSKKIISSCLRLMTNGEPISYNGISQLEVNFAVVSDELGIIRLINSRNFNSLNLLDSNNEKPDCSGQFDTGTNVYADTIETIFSYSGLQDMVISIVKTFDMKFTLYDGENLLFRLESFKELTP